jgi:two-component system chemotaxis response regulator CheB
VLSGTLDDGTDGLRMIKERGGATVVQDPNDAAYGEMPRSALDHVGPDYVASAEEIPEVLYALVDALIEPTDEGEPPPQRADLVEVEFGREPPEGEASLLTCPDCGGVLLERDEGPIVRFACQVGHAYSPESLVEEQGQALESALWSAQRTLEERADLLRRMARRARRARGFDRPGDTADRFERRAEAVTAQADVVRNTILRLRQVENGHDAAIGAVE